MHSTTPKEAKRNLFTRSNQSSATVEICNIKKSFGSHVVLDGISLKLKPGEIFVLMGPSGSGKSVLLKLIAGLDYPTAGEIKINEIPIASIKKNQTYVIALVFQAGALFNSMTVFDNLALYLTEHRLYEEKEIAYRVHRLLEMLSLSDTADKMPADLSGGMRKRVALARGLIMEPHLLLFDEPTSELDPITSASIMEIIGFVSRELNLTTIIVSHDVLLAKTLGHRIGLLNNGTIEELNTPDSLLRSTNPFVKEFLNPTINLQNPRFLSSAS